MRCPPARRFACSATPSTFQKAVAASTRRARSAGTASKPIVTFRTRRGSPRAPRTIDPSTASSLGSPVTPTRLPSRSRGGRMPGCASTAASGRRTRPKETLVETRGPAAYVAEFIGTFLLVLFIGMILTSNSPFGLGPTDFAVIGLLHAFVLAMLIATLGPTSGGHFNPAVTVTL